MIKKTKKNKKKQREINSGKYKLLLFIYSIYKTKYLNIQYTYIVGKYKRPETIFILMDVNDVPCDVHVYTVTWNRKALSSSWLSDTEVYLTHIFSTQNHTIAGQTQLKEYSK